MRAHQQLAGDDVCLHHLAVHVVLANNLMKNVKDKKTKKNNQYPQVFSGGFNNKGC